MTSQLYIDPTERTKIVTKWVKITLFCLHAWATALVLAALFGDNNAELLQNMFSTCTFGIGATLLILLFDRAADVIINRFSTAPVTQVTEKTTEKITSTAPVTEAKPEGNTDAG